MVATDGHRLAMIERAVAGAEAPARASSCRARGWSRSASCSSETGEAELTLVVAEKDVRVQHAERRRSSCGSIEGEFPDYKQVIPWQHARAKVAGRAATTSSAALRRIVAAGERAVARREAAARRRGRSSSSASNPDAGEASEEIEVAYSGDPITRRVQRPLSDRRAGRAAAGDTIELGLTDEVGPGVLHGSQDAELHLRPDADAPLRRRSGTTLDARSRRLETLR